MVQKALEAGFFGESVAPGHALKLDNSEEFMLELKCAALDHKAKSGPTTLYISTERNPTKIAICTLDANKHAQWNIDQVLSPMDGEITLTARGSNPIHVTGFVQAEEEEHDEEHEAYSSDEDGDTIVEINHDMESEDEEAEEEEEIEDTGRFEVIEEISNAPEKTEETEQPSTENNDENHSTDSESKENDATEGKENDVKDNEAKDIEEKDKEKQDKEKSKSDEGTNTKKDEVKSKSPDGKDKKDAKKRPASESNISPKKRKTMKTLRDGVMIEDITIGQGKVANKGRKIQILYKATLASDGKEFEAKMDRKNPFGLRLGIGNSIQGLDIGIEGMCVGGKRIISIPSKVGYGAKGNGQKVPPNADLIYEVELVKVK